MTNTSKKKSPSLLTWLVIGFIILFGLADEFSSDTFDTLLGLVVVLIPIAAGFSIFKAIKKRAGANVHTHDRIDHSTDLKIDSRTGQAVNRTVASAPHSPAEHWKQQLDALLANGTIDRAEYRAMMKRKF